MTFEQAVEYVESYSRSGAPATDLIRFILLMKQLGDPQNDFKSVHVAGTNGKGSVCEYVTCALRAAGKRVGRFTSPYIDRLEERIQINGKNISRPAFALLCEKVKTAVEKTEFTDYSQFEILCAIGMLYFSAEQAEYAVIEVGIGGLLDCTNIIEPEVSVITSIGMDHTDLLGGTLASIARNKAGIIKPSVPCVCSHDQPEEAMKIIAEKCREFGVKLTVPDISRLQLLHMDISDVFFTYKGKNYHGAMSGSHQLANLMCAIEACEVLGLKYGDIYVGTEKAKLPARMECIVSDNKRFIVDGAHNPPAMKACAELLGLVRGRKNAVIGMLGRKDPSASLAQLLPAVDGVTFVDDFDAGAVPAWELVKIAEGYGVKAKTADSLSSALQNADGQATTLITGSLYLAGKARKLLLPDERQI